MRFPRVVWWLGGAVVVVGGGLTASQLTARHPTTVATQAEAAPPKKPAAVAVTVESVTARAVHRAVSVVGSLYGRDEVAVKPKADGHVVRIHHDIGDIVHPGEILAELDATDYEIAAREAHRALEAELAKIGLKELPGKAFDVAQLPPVIRAAARERNAQLRVDRMRRVGNSGGTSAEDRDQAETDLAVAKAETRQAVLEAEATLAAARYKRAAIDSAEQRVRDCRVIAPIPSSGSTDATGRPLEYVVCQRSVTEGELVRGTMPTGDAATLFKLIIDKPLKLIASTPERHLGEIRTGQIAELTVEAYPGETFRGEVARVNPVVDRASRTFQVEIVVPNDDRRLRPGSFAKVRILTRTDSAAATVPEEALVRFAGVTKVFTVEDGTAKELHVRVGATLEVPGPRGKPRTWIEIVGDLPPGAKVVTTGQSQLANGTPVRVRD